MLLFFGFNVFYYYFLNQISPAKFVSMTENDSGFRIPFSVTNNKNFSVSTIRDFRNQLANK